MMMDIVVIWGMWAATSTTPHASQPNNQNENGIFVPPIAIPLALP